MTRSLFRLLLKSLRTGVSEVLTSWSDLRCVKLVIRGFPPPLCSGKDHGYQGNMIEGWGLNYVDNEHSGMNEK